MLSENLIAQIETAHRFFRKTISCFTEEDSGFSPQDGMYTVAAQVEHTAGTIDWFIDGMFSPEGFNLEFGRHMAEARACESLEAAVAHLDRSLENARAALGSRSDEELTRTLPEGPIFGGIPRVAVVGGITDHTAHHRGTLAVYARLIGKEPEMPYA